MPDTPDRFQVQGQVLTEQQLNQIVDECDKPEIVDTAIASLRRKGYERVVKFIEAESMSVDNIRLQDWGI